MVFLKIWLNSISKASLWGEKLCLIITMSLLKVRLPTNPVMPKTGYQERDMSILVRIGSEWPNRFWIGSNTIL